MFRWISTPVMMAAGNGGGNGGGGGAGGSGNGGSGDGNGGDGDGGGTILDAGTGDGDGDGGDKGEWSWGENVPGTGTVPPWLKADKFKTVSDQAKAFNDLETKIGPAAELIGAPKGDYEMPALPEGTTGEWDLEDPMLKTFKEIAKKKDLSQSLFNEVVSEFGLLLAKETAAEETAVTDALAAIGTNAAERITQVKMYLTKELGEEGYNELNDAIGTNVKAYLNLEALVAKAAGDAQLSHLPGKQGAGFTKEDIEAERYKTFPEGHPLAGKVQYEHDKEHRTKVDGMFKELFPGEDHQTVG